MPRTKFKSFLKVSALLLCLGLLGFAGKKAGQQMARSGIVDRAVKPQKAAKSDAGAQASRKPQEAARAGMAATTYKRLKALEDGSPNLWIDFEALTQMDDLIAKLNGAELGELYAMLERNDWEQFRLFTDKVGAAWMAKDPDAALRGLLGEYDRSGTWQARSAFAAWAQDHPEEAFAWLNSAELPEKPPGLRDQLRGNAMYNLVERDFERTTAEFMKMKPLEEDPDGYRNDLSRARVMSAWGHMYAGDPLMRGRLLEFAKTTGNPEDHSQLNYGILKEWPQGDPAGMMNYLYELKDYQESGAIPADKRLESDGTAVAVAIYREYDQAALMWWMQEHSSSREVPGDMREAMVHWQAKYPEKAQAWFDEQPPSPQRDALASSLIPLLIRQKKFTDAAAVIGNMQDAEIRESASTRLGLLWSEQDAKAAAEWQASSGVGK